MRMNTHNPTNQQSLLVYTKSSPLFLFLATSEIDNRVCLCMSTVYVSEPAGCLPGIVKFLICLCCVSTISDRFL
jgi:hypothetical protein